MTPPILFASHLAAPSGATIWLRDFLLARTPTPGDTVVFPGAGPLEAPLAAAGYRIERIALEQSAISGAGLLRLPAMAGARIRAVRSFASLAKEIGCGLVYVNSSVQIAPMLGAEGACIPYVVHVHEATRFGRTHVLKAAFVHRAAGAIFASMEGMRLFRCKPPQALHSPNGVAPELALLRPRRAEFRAALGIAPEAALYLFVGRLQRAKGVGDLAEVWPALRAKTPRAELLLAGPPEPGESDPRIAALAAGAVAGARCLGFRSDVHELIAAADWLVLPSHAEAMPLSIVEAMMIGTPVVARPVGDLPLMLGEGRGILAEGMCSGSLAAALDRTQAGGADYAAAAQRYAQEHLRLDRQVAQISAFLAPLIQPNKSR